MGSLEPITPPQASPPENPDIAQALQLDYGTVSPLLKRLEAHELVTRHRARDNESRVLVTLTPAGRDLHARAAGIPEALRRALQRTNQVANRELIDTLQELTVAAQSADALEATSTDSAPEVHGHDL